AFAQDAGGASAPADNFVVVGSRIARDGQDITAQPVQYLSREQFELTPAENVADFLQELPVNNGFTSSTYNNEYAGGNSTINLRGVGDQYTLVLINGRRFGGETAPDIGALPPEAISGIEILKTGSSAIYGSDAVAGVVNIKLRDDFEGVQLTGTYGVATRDFNPPASIADYEDVQVGAPLSGDGSNSRIGALFGTSGDRWRFTGSVSYQDYEGFARADRDVTATRDYRRFGGADRRGFRGAPHTLINFLTGEFQSIDISRFEPGYVPTSADDFVAFNGDLQRLSGAEQGVAPPMERYSGHWSASYDINENTKLYTFGYVDYREQEFVYHEPRVDINFIAPNNPNNVIGAPFFGFISFDPTVHGFNSEDIETTNWQGTIGVEGRIGERWNYDVSYTNWDREIEIVGKNAVSVSAAQELVNSGELNPFCYRCTSPEVFAQLTANPVQVITDGLESFDLLFTGELLEYDAGAVSLAFGYQFRGVDGAVKPDEVAQTFDQFNRAPLFPGEGSRDVDAYFAELFVPLYRGGDGDFVTSAEVTAAVRRESYSDFGDATVSQGLGRVVFIDEHLILRAGFAESFRAPAIAQLIEPVITAQNASGFFFDPVRGGFLDLDITNGGNPDLVPEDGESTNMGIVVRPEAVPGLYFSADYWTLEIDGIIRRADIQGVLNGTETGGSITRDPVTQYPTVDRRLSNSGLREIAGWDFALSYGMESNAGSFDFYANASYFTEFEDSAGGETQVFLAEFINDLATPRFRFAGGVNWRKAAWDAGLSFHYFGSYRDRFEAGDLAVNRKVDEQYTADLQVGYDFGMARNDSPLDGLRVFVGVENIFDQDPPWLAESANGWDRFYGDIVGRYVYGGARVTF
ncbi:MAG: TonB-dependent receptor plug domain-containing protein, partial [Pseudomonadota bacterium]